jgi:hypothetical protein
MDNSLRNSAGSEESPIQTETDATESPDVTIAIEMYLPENVPTYYSDAIAILHSQNEFVISHSYRLSIRWLLQKKSYNRSRFLGGNAWLESLLALRSFSL